MYRETSTTHTGNVLTELSTLLSADAVDAAKELADEAEKNGERTQINVMIGSKPRQTLAAGFVMTFTDNLRLLADLGITPSEMRLLAFILEAMEYGNLLNLSQAAAGKALGFSKAHMSRLFQSLRAKGVLFDRGGHTYVNPRLFLKGLPHKLDPVRAGALRDLSDAAGKEAGPSFGQTLR